MASDFSNLLERLNIKFNDIHLLETAFTHRSYLNEVKDVKASNERLEFLGDSILSFIISTYLYSSRPKDPEGDLTNLRSYIVKTKSLAEASEKLELGKYLKLSKGEEISGGRYNTQLLANTFEALLGAIFLDLGLETATKIIHQTLLPDFRQELAQEKLKESPHYKIIGTKGPDHAKEFMVAVFIKGKEVGRGTGSSKQAAEEMAALNALKSFT